MKVTKKAIADYLGISRTAVSLVLNDSPNCTLSDETREKIINAAKELGYYDEPDIGKKICFVLYNRKPDDPRYMIDLRNIEELCSQNDYKLLFLSLQTNTDDFGKLLSYVEGQDVDGAIIAGDVDEKIISIMDSTKVPYIIYGGIERENVNIVSQDAEKIAYEAVKYLIKFGHRKIALFNGAFTFLVHRQILKGYQKALESEKIPYDGVLVQISSEEDGYELSQRINMLNVDYTAIFCANTIIQFGALQWHKERGIAIPKRVSLLGYGNSELVKVCNPKLTTFSFDYEEIAKAAVDRLISIIADADQKKKNIYVSDSIILEGGTVSFTQA